MTRKECYNENMHIFNKNKCQQKHPVDKPEENNGPQAQLGDI